MKEFGDELKRKRTAADMSMDELAERANVSKGYISQLERSAPNVNGHVRRPSVEIVDRIADALDWPRPSARLLAGYAPPDDFGDDLDGDRPTLIAYYDGLDRNDRDELLEFAELKWRRAKKRELVIGRKAE